nr:hypothetical protein Iba_chr12dCG13040 [Ipomoea batatas]
MGMMDEGGRWLCWRPTGVRRGQTRSVLFATRRVRDEDRRWACVENGLLEDGDDDSLADVSVDGSPP